MKARSWVALIVAPTVALLTQGLLYSLVSPSCGVQMRVNLHIAAAVALAIVVVLAVVAFGESSLRRREPAAQERDQTQPPQPRRFLANLACAVAALSALVVAAMWLAVWVLSPCSH